MPVTAHRAAAVLLVFCAAAHGQQIPTLSTDESIRLALGRTIDEVAYEKTPLEQVIKDLRKRLGINIHVQWKELEDFGLKRSTPVRLKLKKLPAQRVLQLVLRDIAVDVRCGYELQDGVVVVSTAERLQEKRSLRTHRVRGLIERGSGGGGAIRDPDQLANRAYTLTQLIVDCIEPDSWVQNGGVGTIDMANGVLFIRNFPRVHRDVRGLLTVLRATPKHGSAPVDPADRVTAGDERIAEALKRAVPRAKFTHAPLAEVVDWVREWLDASVYVPWKELRGSGIERDHKVSLTLGNLPLERVLRQILDDIGVDVRLGFEIEDGVLVISTLEDLDRRESTRIYEVSDITKSGIGPERFIQIVVSTVEPDTWAQNGGPATISVFDHRLVIRNTRPAHRRVEKLLGDIRKLAAREKAGKREP